IESSATRADFTASLRILPLAGLSAVMRAVEPKAAGEKAPLGLSYALALFVVLAAFFSLFPWVRFTNFGGYDEWSIHYVLSRGLVSIPYANRPFELLLEWPARLLLPHSFLGYHALYAVYLPGAALIVVAILWRVAPEEPLLGLLSGVFVVVWAPSDITRLGAVE